MLRKFSEVVAGRPGSPVDESPSWLNKFQEEDEKEALEKAVKLSKNDVDSDDDSICEATPGFGYHGKGKPNLRREPQFESWEEEEFCPGEPVLPLGCFKYTKRNESQLLEIGSDSSSGETRTTKVLRGKGKKPLSQSRKRKKAIVISDSGDSNSAEDYNAPSTRKRWKMEAREESSYATGGSNESASDKEKSDLEEGDVHALPPVYFTSKKKGLGTEEAARLLLGKLKEERVATFKPFTVSRSSVYVFQCKHFSNIHDVLTDGCGVRKGTGTKTFYATKGNDGSVEIVVHPHGPVQESYKIERRFYTHARYKDVKKNFVLIKDPSGALTDFALLQYIFTRGERQLEAKPHGNSKKGKTFYPTQKSTKDEIKKLAQASNPKEVFHRLIREFTIRKNLDDDAASS